MKKIIALAGTPNCGKTTLFNQISKSHGAVGNRPGVTVEKKYGALRSDPDFAVVDLPGTYSLASKKAEERLTGEFLTGGGADCVITVIFQRSRGHRRQQDLRRIPKVLRCLKN